MGETADRTDVFARTLVALLDAYRALLAPLLSPACRFAPTCSVFAREAIHRHGPVKGMLLALGRLGRCQPWHPGGYDPVPPRAG